MKILKKFLQIFLISLIIILKVKAYTTTEYNETFIYDETYYNEVISTNQERLNNLHNYLPTYNFSCNNQFITIQGINAINNGNYFLIIENMNTNSWTVKVSKSDNTNNPYIQSRYDNTKQNKFHYVACNYTANFNNNNQISSFNFSNTAGGYSYYWNFLSTDNPTQSDVTLRIENTYFDNYFLNNNQNLMFKDWTNINPQVPIKINGTDNIYNPNSNIPLKEWIESLEPEQPIPVIYQPQIEYLNGYNKVTYYIDNYTPNSIENGYFVRIVNNTDGTFENISPDINNVNQTITKNYYENVNLSIEIHDREYNILSHYDINTNISYNEQSSYSIKINGVSNEQKIVYYDYIINNNNNVKCYYSINNNNFIENSNCDDPTNTYYLQLTNNGNITWQIRDLENNILYSYSQNFTFDISQTYINFEDKFNNDFLNLNILINRYQTNDVIEYSINNGNFIEVTFLEDYSISQNIKYFTLNNINDNDLVIVRIKRNNEIITTARYRANYIKYTNSSNEINNINDIFNKININNVNEELREYIIYFGNLIINSKIGNLLLLQTFCLIIIIIIKMIRN